MAHSSSSLAALSLMLVAMYAPSAGALQIFETSASAHDRANYERKPVSAWLPDGLPRREFSIPDGAITAIATDEDRLYIGGRFGWVGQYTGALALVEHATGAPNVDWPKISGEVFAIVSDGAGGWIVGGDLRSVDGQTRQGLARVHSDGSVDPWNPSIEGTVRALAIRGQTVYAGGTFGGERPRLAAIDLATGDVLPWNPDADAWSPGDVVVSLAVSPNAVYVGGVFATTIGGAFRRNLVSLDPATAQVLSFDPAPMGAVQALLLSGSELLVGGSFTSIGGRPIRSLAAVDAVSGVVQIWNPNVDGAVSAFARSGNAIFVGGSFHAFGGSERHGAAAIDATDRSLLQWNPNVSIQTGSARVAALLVHQQGVYIGGTFDRVSMSERRALACVNATTGAPTSWRADVAGLTETHVDALAAGPGGVVAGGTFRTIGGEARAGLAAFRLSTGELLSWAPKVHDVLNPSIIGTVTCIEPAGDRVYVGGSFRYVNNEEFPGLAAIERETGELLSTFDTQMQQGFLVADVLHTDAAIFAAGSMWIDGVGARTLAAFDPIHGAWIASWQPAANATVRSIAPARHPQQLVIAGSFTEVGSPPQSRPGVAAIDSITGHVTAWNPQPNAATNVVLPHGERAWLAGRFDVVAGEARRLFAEVDGTTGFALPFEFETNAGSQELFAIASHRPVLYLGGTFDHGTAPPYFVNLAAIDTRTGVTLDWNPRPNAAVRELHVADEHLIVTGDFSSIAGVERPQLAVFKLRPID